ncbi:MAG: hypothetical protein HC808_14410 [Candidatus Competibacteraceae bacterium]|nr:hypothetical protein [Candidatus Competibacteraceae bacterium]
MNRFCDRRLRPFGWLLVLLLAISANAQDTVVASLDPFKAAEQQNARRQALEEEKATIERLQEELRAQTEEQPAKLDALQTEQLTEALVEQAQLDSSAIRLRQADLQADITNSERRSKELEQGIRELEAREQLLKILPRRMPRMLNDSLNSI